MSDISDMKAPGGRVRRRIVAVSAALLVAFLMSGFALLVRTSERDARASLSDRWGARATLTASFARSYIDDMASRERAQAVRLLWGPVVDQATFDEVVASFGFDGAVLLDSEGRALQVWPAKPELVGTNLANNYAHLRAAVEGSVAVSNVVPSAAKGLPVTAVAVPFETSYGRRVLSGAFTPSNTPLGLYFGTVSTLKNSAAVLVDGNGTVVTSGREDPAVAAQMASLHPGVQEIDGTNGPITVAMAPVPGTTWRVVQSAPSAELFAPLSGTRWAPWILWGALAVLGTVAVVMLAHLMSMRARAAMTARTDLLTGLPNRRAMDETLTRAVADASRHGQPLSVLMLDLDHFKAINDALGHRGGDVVLQQTATKLRETLRSGDVAGRWGGEEFLVILPHTSAAGAAIVGDRVRFAISTIDAPEGSNIDITASIGVAVLENDDVEALVGAADDALYCAKAAGRNRVIRAAVSAPAAHASLV